MNVGIYVEQAGLGGLWAYEDYEDYEPLNFTFTRRNGNDRIMATLAKKRNINTEGQLLIIFVRHTYFELLYQMLL